MSTNIFQRIAARFIVPAKAAVKNGGAFDIEGNGLLDTVTELHCIAIADLNSDRVDQYGPKQIDAALEHLSRLDYIVAHNGLDYDLHVLQKLKGWVPKADCTVADSLIAGRLILPNITDLDDEVAAMGDPKLGKLRGRYSIEAWGARLRIPKVGTDIEDWSKWTPEMQARCAADAVICKELWCFLQPDGYSQRAMLLEYRAAAVCEQITRAGVPFDLKAAEQLRRQWAERRAEIDARLQRQFPGTNLNSRPQLGALLEARGWVPAERTEKTR
jgi:DNA polymerase I